MKVYRFSLTALVLFVLAACANNRVESTDRTPDAKDTNLVDTRRNTTDTVNYITNDSGNKSQQTIDMDAPTNSRY